MSALHKMGLDDQLLNLLCINLIQECARRMLHGIPFGGGWYYVDWTGYIVGHVSSFVPEYIERFVRVVVQLTSEQFANFLYSQSKTNFC